jgi:hypothetical protein
MVIAHFELVTNLIQLQPMAKKYTATLTDTDEKQRKFEVTGTEEFAIGVGLGLYRGCIDEHIGFEPNIPLFTLDEDCCGVNVSELSKYIIEWGDDSRDESLPAERFSRDDSKMTDDIFFVDHHHPNIGRGDVTLGLSRAVLDGFMYGLALLDMTDTVTIFKDGKRVQGFSADMANKLVIYGKDSKNNKDSKDNKDNKDLKGST